MKIWTKQQEKEFYDLDIEKQNEFIMKELFGDIRRVEKEYQETDAELDKMEV